MIISAKKKIIFLRYLMPTNPCSFQRLYSREVEVVVSLVNIYFYASSSYT